MKIRTSVFLFAILCSEILPPQLSAQNMVFVSRNGENTAYCGPLGGPLVDHLFSLPEPTHDVISLSHPGATNMPQSSAASQLDVTTSGSGITISAVGSARRGPLRPFIDFGAYAVAGARDEWEFTLAAPARFTFNATLNTSSETLGTTGGFVFGALAFNQIFPDPGTPPDAFGGSLTNSGTVVREVKGRMLPGRYFISFNCRADGNNTYPYSGSFNFAMSLELGPDVPIIAKLQIEPNGLKLEWTDLPQKQFTVETASSLSDNSWAAVPGIAWPTSDRSVVLPSPSTFPAFYRVKAE